VTFEVKPRFDLALSHRRRVLPECFCFRLTSFEISAQERATVVGWKDDQRVVGYAVFMFSAVAWPIKKGRSLK